MQMRPTRDRARPVIAVVGPCASGKSLLVRALRERQYNAREVAQEHSAVPAMWQRITQPDILVYLDVSADVARRRRTIHARDEWWTELAQRLSHARQHADIYIDSDKLTPQEIIERTLAMLCSFPGRMKGQHPPDVAGLQG